MVDTIKNDIRLLITVPNDKGHFSISAGVCTKLMRRVIRNRDRSIVDCQLAADPVDWHPQVFTIETLWDLNKLPTKSTQI